MKNCFKDINAFLQLNVYFVNKVNCVSITKDDIACIFRFNFAALPQLQSTSFIELQ